VLVLERRDVIGGVATTEEVVPGYKFSRVTDVVGLLRPKIVSDLRLKERGLHIFPRNPHVLAPLMDSSKFLMLGPDINFNADQISKFSARDAKKFRTFQAKLERLVASIEPLMDEPPIDFFTPSFSAPLGLRDKLSSAMSTTKLARRLARLGMESMDLLELFIAPLSKILQRELESEPLQATIARSALAGSFTSPSQHGTGALLIRHLLGINEGAYGHWSYVRGGLGMLSDVIAEAAREKGAKIVKSSTVDKILVEGKRAVGIELQSGVRHYARRILSNADPVTTFTRLCPSGSLDPSFVETIQSLNFRSGVFKLNVALSGLPNFRAVPRIDGTAGPEHKCTVYMGAEKLDDLDSAYFDALMNKRPSSRPLVALTIPSTIDSTLAPAGHHVAGIVVQHAPYEQPWHDEAFKTQFVKKVLSVVDIYAPGFSKLVVGMDALSPLDIETTFGVHQGNIFHGAMTLDQLYFLRPSKNFSRYRTPIANLYLCGSGTHPGGGVSGASGRNCANVVVRDMKSNADGEVVMRSLRSMVSRK